ncbi:MAG: OmpA family protein [Pseudomonadota bacterium]|nr:OmpA family protein [Pseudomonadota bacterium]
MRLLVLGLLWGVVLAGCSTKNADKIRACEGSNVKNCSPVIYFLPDSDEITPYGKKRLDWSVEKMNRWPNKRMLITAYAYEWGGDEYNMDLSRRRARSVGRYFVQNGIDPRRIRVRYLGNANPICLEPECQKLNRRAIVEMYNL